MNLQENYRSCFIISLIILVCGIIQFIVLPTNRIFLKLNIGERKTSIHNLNKFKVDVIQIMTEDFEKYKTWTDTVIKWCRKYNFNYHRTIYDASEQNWTNQIKPVFIKSHVEKIVMNSMEESSWTIFLDADVCVKNFNFNIIKFIMNHQKYDFMFQDSNHTTNSGFLLIKNTEYSLKILNNWIQKFTTCSLPTPGDQMYLQATILDYAYEFRNQTFDDECCVRVVWGWQANFCYERHMKNLGFNHDFRKFEKILGIPHNDTRFNMHDAGDEYQPGDIFYHGHKNKKCL